MPQSSFEDGKWFLVSIFYANILKGRPRPPGTVFPSVSVALQFIQMQSVFIMGIQLYVRINYSSIVRGDEMPGTRWNSDDRKAEV